MKAVFRPILSAVALGFVLSGCALHFEQKGDYYAEERFRATVNEIAVASTQAEEAILREKRAAVDEGVDAHLRRHFAKADEIVLNHTRRVHDELSKPSFAKVFDDYHKRRLDLLSFTLAQKARYVPVESNEFNPSALPTGAVHVSRRFVETFSNTEAGYDPVLLGIFLHELIHVRDGHAVEQWATADARKAWARGTILNAVSNVTSLIPLFSVSFTSTYPLSHGASNQMPALSEFAADLGAISFLQKEGLNPLKYIAFIESITPPQAAGTPATPSLLQQRAACMKTFRETSFAYSFKGVLVGTPEDNQFQVLDLRPAYQILSLLDSPEQLAKEFPTKGTVSIAEHRQIALDKVRKMVFIGCAIRAVFDHLPLEDGVLMTPTFDLLLFTQY
jgi:hypothetical protein